MEKAELIEIVKRCQYNDSEAQEMLIMEVQQSVYYQCLKFLHNPEDALDAMQDVLINVITKIHTLNEPEAFWGWVNRMTANHCKNMLRKTGELQIPEDEEGNSLLDVYETLDEQTIPDQALDREETRRIIVEMIDDLPAPQRMCVIMYYYNEMSVKEIAEVLDVSENTVKSRLNYARKAIKEGTEKYEKQGIKLYSVSLLPFLLYFLRADAKACGLGTQAIQTITSGVVAAVSETVVASAQAGASISVGAEAGVSAGLSAGTAESAAVVSGSGSTAGTTAGITAGSSGVTGMATSAIGATAVKASISAAIKGSTLATRIVAGVLAVSIAGGGAALISQGNSEDNKKSQGASINSIVGHTYIGAGGGEFASDVDDVDEEEKLMRAAMLQRLASEGRIMYAKLIDMNGDGTDELLIGKYNPVEGHMTAHWGFEAWVWNGSELQWVDLNQWQYASFMEGFAFYKGMPLSFEGNSKEHIYIGSFTSTGGKTNTYETLDEHILLECCMWGPSEDEREYLLNGNEVSKEIYEACSDNFEQIESILDPYTEVGQTDEELLYKWDAYLTDESGATERPDEYPSFFSTVADVRKQLEDTLAQ